MPFHKSNKILYDNITQTTLVNQAHQSGGTSSSQEKKPPQLRHQKSRTQETVKIPVERKSTRWFRVMTTLHPYPLEGPHYLLESHEEWYCDNQKCKYTVYGKYSNYPLPCWRSTELGPGFVLCDNYKKTKQLANANFHIQKFFYKFQTFKNTYTNFILFFLESTCIRTSTIEHNSPSEPKNKCNQRYVNVVTSYGTTDDGGNGNEDEDEKEEQEGVTAGNNNASVQSVNKEVEEKKEQTPNAPQVLKQGWLLKQGAKLKTWKQRFCMLQSDGKLYYFENDKSKYYKGYVDLQNCRKIRSGKKLDFDIITDERTWKFVCKKLETRDQWLALLCGITGCTIEAD
ncbi:hypothetical protein RFI_10895 [Reticulomyxa filosa]|uniref:PH domain-containing protein n=1 Tax=Reticulomyxa filosa TaxID=46433 RepID=X6NLI2_RETFI|nr:hypothetical protein RFI_10895 [Reticulomyxa filosa]|eukprot:ETO26242.1 hypothetical protein RFI_10895 [Reticulomyxa filosa]